MSPAAVAGPPQGKMVAGRLYLHVSALDEGDASASDASSPAGLAERLAQAEHLANLRRGEHFNLVRVDAEGDELALLLMMA